MKKFVCRLLLAGVALGACFAGAEAQQKKDIPRFEIGAQFSSLTIQEPNSVAIYGNSETFRTEPGFGGRFTANITPDIAAEAEVNFFPNDNGSRRNFTGGRTVEGLFGVKAGKRFERFGVYGKARPGFVRFERTITGYELTDGMFPNPRFASRTEFAADIGGVLEFYPSRRIVTRFDIGDTLIRYKERMINLPVFNLTSPPSLQAFTLAGETRNNFQFSAGIGFRF